MGHSENFLTSLKLRMILAILFTFNKKILFTSFQLNSSYFLLIFLWNKKRFDIINLNTASKFLHSNAIIHVVINVTH
jgi:hypothetical protein